MAVSKASRHAPRRRLPLSEKRRIVELTLHTGASLRAIAREQGVNRNSLYQWRALYRAGKLNSEPAAATHGVAFLPVSVAPAQRAVRAASACALTEVNVVQVTLASGATLRIEAGALEAGLICALVAELRR